MNHLYLYSPLSLSVFREPLPSARLKKKKMPKIFQVFVTHHRTIIPVKNHHSLAPRRHHFSSPLSSQISIFQQYRDRTHLTPHRLESCSFLKLTMTNCHRNAAVLVHVDVDYLEHVTLEAGIYGRPNRVLRTAARHFGAKFELFGSLLFIFFKF